MACTELTWVTASPRHHLNPPLVSSPLCHVHLTVRHSKHFWWQKWAAVRDYLEEHAEINVAMVTDVYDVYVSPWTTSSVLSRFHRLTAPSKSLLLSTEDTCWIGRVCNRTDVQQFQEANVSNHRFMQSQFMGDRSSVLHMLRWGLGLGITDDMHMMYRYILVHPDRVALDENFELFGSLALAEPSSSARYMCRDGWCGASTRRYTCSRDPSHHGVCIASDSFQTMCPLVWHGNGLLSRAFLETNPECSRVFGRRLK